MYEGGIKFVQRSQDAFDNTQPIVPHAYTLGASEAREKRAKEFVREESEDEMRFISLINKLISLSKLT